MTRRSVTLDSVRQAKASLFLQWTKERMPPWKPALLNEAAYAALRKHGLARAEVHVAIRDLVEAGLLTVKLDVKEGGIVLLPVEEGKSNEVCGSAVTGICSVGRVVCSQAGVGASRSL